MRTDPADDRLPLLPLTAWIGGQLFAVALGVFDARLWAHHPNPPSQLALSEIVVAQVLIAGLTFTTLLAEWRSAVVAMVTASMFLAAGAVVANRPLVEIGRAAVAVGLWLGGLSALSIAVRRSPGLQRGIAMGIRLWMIGGILFLYLSADRPGAETEDPGGFAGGPIATAVELQVIVDYRVLVLTSPAAAAFLVFLTTTFAHRVGKNRI